MVPEGDGQFIASFGVSDGSRRFDSTGQAVSAPAYRKSAASGYLEYGFTPWLSLIAAPTLSHENGAAANSVTGSDSSAFGARLQLYGTPTRVVALQVLVQPPLGGGDRAAQLADGGARSLATDTRLMLGQSFTIFGWSGFVDLEPGARVRADPFPTEARFDLALGLRPRPNWMILVQDFASYAPPAAQVVPRAAYDKLQVSLVYDLSRRWSVQVGAVRTVAGINAVRETGPLAALWYRF